VTGKKPGKWDAERRLGKTNPADEKQNHHEVTSEETWEGRKDQERSKKKLGSVVRKGGGIPIGEGGGTY